MLEKEALNFILQDMPESIIGAMFCFVFLDLKFRWKKIFIIAVLLSLTNMVELLPLSTGVRSLVLIIALAVYIRLLTRKDLSKVFLAVLINFLLSAAGDTIWGLPLLYITRIPYVQVYNTPYLRALFSYPTLVSLLAVTYFLYRYKKKKKIVFE